MSDDERKAVEQAIRAAETRAGADFVCVLLQRSAGYEFHPLAWAVLVALATPWVLLRSTDWPFTTILLVQMGVFAVLAIGLAAPPIRRLIVPRRLQRAAAHRAAAEQFLIRDLATTPDRRSVLMFISAEEHYARVLADEGALTGIADDLWRGSVDRLVTEARRGRHAAGFIAALDHCAEALSRTAPADRARRDALPNRFIVEG